MKWMALMALALQLGSNVAFAQETSAPASSATTDSSAATGPKDPGSPPERPAWKPIPTDDARVVYALGARVRGLFVPSFILTPFLQQFSTLTSEAVGLEFTRRKGTLDIVVSLDFGFYSPADGNFLGAGKIPELDTHFTQFRNLNMLSLDVAFYWQHDLADWLAITLGGGVGMGIVLGDIFTVNNGSVGCKDSPGDLAKCYPVAPSPSADYPYTYKNSQGTTVNIGEIKPGDPDFQNKLNGTTAAQPTCIANKASKNINDPNYCLDTASHPFYHAADKPPVLPIVNFVIGFKFKIHRHFNINMNGGFRDGFVFGGGPEYIF